MKRKGSPTKAGVPTVPDEPEEEEEVEESVAQVITRILKSANFFERLDLPVQLHEPQTVRVSYKKLALLVHPGALIILFSCVIEEINASTR